MFVLVGAAIALVPWADLWSRRQVSPVAGVTARGYHDRLFLDRGLHAAYQRHANSFITKSLVPTEFLATIRETEDGWITIVRLPTRPG